MSTPQSRFGAVPITLIRAGGGSPVDWTPDARNVTFHFPGGNVSEVQVLGRGVLTVEYLVRVLYDDFAALDDLLNTEQVFRVPRMTTAYPAAREFQEFGELYKEWDAVLLASIADVQLHRSGIVHCVSRFQRTAVTP